MKFDVAWAFSPRNLVPLVACLILGTSLHATETKITTVAVPTGGKAMSAKTDAGGTIHLLYDTPDGPYYVRYGEHNALLTTPISLVDKASRRPGLEFITWDMAVTPQGAVHVALGNNAWKLKLPQQEWGFFYTRLLPTEKSFSPLKNLNQTPSEGFSLAVGDAGTVTAVWMADKLFANISHNGGDTFAPTIEIDPSLDPCNCCTTSSVYGADGRLAILYREETNNQRDMYLALWDQTQNRVSKTRVSATPWKIDSCPMTYYSVILSGTGFAAAWPTMGQIYFAKLDADGSPIGPVEIETPGKNGMRSGILPGRRMVNSAGNYTTAADAPPDHQGLSKAPAVAPRVSSPIKASSSCFISPFSSRGGHYPSW